MPLEFIEADAKFAAVVAAAEKDTVACCMNPFSLFRTGRTESPNVASQFS
jgi:hypothetical protein